MRKGVAAGDLDEIEGRPRSSWMRSAIRSSNRQSFPTTRTSASRRTGLGEAKIAAHLKHPFAPAGGWRQVNEVDVDDVLGISAAATRGRR